MKLNFNDNFVLSFSSETNSFSFDDGTCTGYDIWSTVPNKRSIKGPQNEGIFLYMVDTEPENYVSMGMFDDKHILYIFIVFCRSGTECLWTQYCYYVGTDRLLCLAQEVGIVLPQLSFGHLSLLSELCGVLSW